jgi:hypothetical protein
MNERIQQLAEQAELIEIVDDAYIERNVWQSFVETFAKMIASECVKIAESKMTGGGTAREIRAHFGLTKNEK